MYQKTRVSFAGEIDTKGGVYDVTKQTADHEEEIREGKEMMTKGAKYYKDYDMDE